MNATDARLSVVIPTKDHPDDLRRLLASLAGQRRRPDEVIVVDGGSTPVDAVLQDGWPFPCRYERVFPPGLAKQANRGLGAASPSSALIACIDDDMVLDGDALEAMMAFWRGAPADVGGAAFNLVNNTEPPRFLWVKSLLGLESRRRGIFLASGYQSKIGALDRTTEVEWIYSGATVWRRELVERFQFDEWFEGPGHLYEVELCLRLTGLWRLVVVADARAREIAGARAWNDTPLGRWQVVNRLYLVRKHRGRRGLSLARCWIALCGQFAVNLARALLERNPRYLQRARGNCQGFLEAASTLASSRRLPSQ